MKIVAITGMASVQDLGRFGQRKHGIGVNGVMDCWALTAGNALLNNPDNTAAIEVTLGSLTIEFDPSDIDPITGQLSLCLTGALYEAYLIDSQTHQRERVPNGWRVSVKAGQRLELVRAVQGMHGYICIQGGLAINPVLGSASTNTKAAFGGHQGRFLQLGDVLNIAAASRPALSKVGMANFVDAQFDKTADDDNSGLAVIRVLKNSEYEYFSKTAQADFTQQAYKLLSSSNRMGYRLEGQQPLTLINELQMNSHGVDVGMIQVPPQGQPIVLMADTQTTGGYPKIASIIKADIGRFAQLRFGQTCRFQWVTLDQAMAAYQARQRYIAQIRAFA